MDEGADALASTPRPGDRAPAERGPAARRLDRPPADRYRGFDRRDSAESTGAPIEGPTGGGSVARSAAWTAPAAIVALIVYWVFAGPLAFSAGLVVVGIFAGRMIGLTAKAGGGTAVTSDQRVVVALVTTVGWFVAAQVATWIYARNEGGVLPILDYLLQTFGPVVPLVAIAAVLAAWWSAR